MPDRRWSGSTEASRDRNGSVPPFLFIVGAPRSGTTMLQVMLASHRLLAIPPESYFIPRIHARLGNPPPDDPVDVTMFGELLSADPRFQRWELNPNQVIASLASDPPRTFPDAVRRVYRMYAMSRSKPRYGDKTPHYVSQMHRLRDLIPEARFVHLVRDGRDVAASLRDVPFGPSNLAGCAWRWATLVQDGLRAGSELGPQRYLEVRYERLVRDPRRQLSAIVEFLELPFDERMLDHTAQVDEVLGPVARIHSHHRVRQRPTPGLRSWDRDMSPNELAIVEHVAGDVLEQTGYQRCSASVRIPQRMTASLQLTWTRLRRRIQAGRRRVLSARLPRLPQIPEAQ